MKANESLISLNISEFYFTVGGNQIGDEGIKVISETLAMNKILLALKIGIILFVLCRR